MSYLICVIILILILIIVMNFKKTRTNYFGSGKKISSKTLNKTLIVITNILNKNNIDDWFIGYGTLLGIVRNNSCIDNDDDIDILINKFHKDKILNIFTKEKFKVEMNKSNFLRIHKENFAPIDFYLCDKIENDYHDSWENSIWKNVNPLVYYNWNDVILNLPKNPKQKLKNRYGKDWMIPKNSKGNTNRGKNKPGFI